MKLDDRDQLKNIQFGPPDARFQFSTHRSYGRYKKGFYPIDKRQLSLQIFSSYEMQMFYEDDLYYYFKA